MMQNPETSINLVNFYPEDRLDRYPSVLTLGIARLGSLLSYLGHNINLISIPNGKRFDLNQLLKDSPETVGLSVNYWDRDIAERAIFELRGSGFNGDILVGGPEASIMLSEKKYTPEGDGVLFFPTEAEIPIQHYLELRHTKTKTVLQEDIESDSQKGLNTTEIAVGLPLFSEDFYGLLTSDAQRQSRFTWYDTVRGCPFSCGYCDHGRGQKTVTRYPEEHVKKEVKLIAERFDNVFIIDPVVGGGDPRKAQQRLQLFHDLAPTVNLEFYMRPETSNDELIRLIDSMKIKNILIGLQTLNPNVPKWLRQNNKDSLQTLKKLCEVAPVTIELIVGLLGDNLTGLQQTLDNVACDLHPAKIAAYPLTVLDGTRLGKMVTYTNQVQGEGLWVKRDAVTHRALESSSYTESEMEKMKLFAHEFVSHYNNR